MHQYTGVTLRKWARGSAISALLFQIASSSFAAQTPITYPESPVSNGKLIANTPDGTLASVGSLPINAIVDPSGKYAIVTDAGYRSALTSVDLSTGNSVNSLPFLSSRGGNRSNGLFYGLAASGNTIYASMGAASKIAVSTIGSDGTLTPQTPISAQPGDFIVGLSSDTRGYLYAVNGEYYVSDSSPANMTTPGSLAVYSEKTGLQVARLNLGDTKLTSFPFAVATLSSGLKTYVTSQRDGVVYVVDTSQPNKISLLSTITVGKNPVALLFSADQKTLYVANANSDTISVIDADTDSVTSTISLRPSVADTLPGVTPLDLCLSSDGKQLYVALGDMNAVAVIDTSSETVTGYIPAGWYPTAALTTGSKLLIVDAKGTIAQTPNNPPAPGGPTSRDRYVLNILEGKTQLIDIPTPVQLATDTQTVIRRNKLAELAVKSYGVLSKIGIASGKIKHIIYIIKENRTYDQVLGDLKEGNGDPTLAIFGKNVTPNLHALAERFVLLDNFYDSGDVSGDGWNWSTQGYASEYVARTIPYNYSGRGIMYNYEGQNNGYITGGFPADDPDGNLNSILAPKGVPAIPDVAESAGGHIWDDALALKLTIRNYGFYLSEGVPGAVPDNYPDSTGLQPPGHNLAGITDIDFRQFDLSYPDSDAPSYYYAQNADPNVLRKMQKYGSNNSVSRYAEWAHEYDEMILKDPSGDTVPNLMMVRFMCDHTSAMRAGNPSPRSDVADNDYAVGELIDHVSRTSAWKSTAIFVIEDDAQDGEDHVDCHRSICFVASPYIKAHSVDHTFYNTDSVLRTMEILLGMKPMCQYDAVAQPISDWISQPLNVDPYNAILPDESIIAERNPSAQSLAPSDPRRWMVLASDSMNFSHADAAPTDEVNRIVWQSVKGVHSIPPKPQHRVILVNGNTIDTSSGDVDDDD